MGALGDGTDASRWGGWSRVAAWARGGAFTARLLSSQLGIVGRTLSSAADVVGLGGMLVLRQFPSRPRNLASQGARRPFQMLRKDRPIPESVVEIDRDGAKSGSASAPPRRRKQSAVAIRAT